MVRSSRIGTDESKPAGRAQSADSVMLNAAMDDDEGDLDFFQIDALVAAHQSKAKKVRLHA